MTLIRLSIFNLQIFPDEETPSFRSAVLELFNVCNTLSLCILEVMGQAMELRVCIYIKGEFQQEYTFNLAIIHS